MQEQTQATPGHGDKLIGTGFIVFVILAIMTGGEFIAAKEISANVAPLAVVAVVKAILILWYFMHVVRAWVSEHGHGHGEAE